MGRPPVENPADKVIPAARVTEAQLLSYHEAAGFKGEKISEWIRRNLDNAAKRDIKKQLHGEKEE